MAQGATLAELKAKVLEFAQGFAATSGLEVTARIERDEPESIMVAFDGPDARLLVGRGGQVLDALQLVAINVIAGRGNARLHVTFDADSYRVRREQVLIQLAQELAEQVESSGQEAVLDPLPPLERRIVHQALTAFPGIMTYSEGEEPDRYIVIAPKA